MMSKKLLNKPLSREKLLKDFLYSENGTTFKNSASIPFYKMQQKIATGIWG